jgi:hypothetical protein
VIVDTSYSDVQLLAQVRILTSRLFGR